MPVCALAAVIAGIWAVAPAVMSGSTVTLPKVQVLVDSMSTVHRQAFTADSIKTLPVLYVRLDSADSAAGHRRGWTKALEDIAAKSVAFPTYGLIRDHDPWEDSTGLVILPSSGCVVTTEILGFHQGYYDCIEAWIDSSGIPDWSRKKWLPLLNDPKATFDSMVSLSPALQIPSGGTAYAESPDGRWRIHLSAGDTPRTVVIQDSTGQVHRDEKAVETSEEILDFVWGPAESDVVVLRYDTSLNTYAVTPFRQQRYRMMDLRSGRDAGTSEVRLPDD